eukprot:TRINITY_DN5781_c0_g1_i3.p1 TRINITY_DN5781_c0_g1~~TRINITY_DN5781_c0_g1_i3.p1  ORF type:complete len:223 (-),score=37.80 TRINITY_DN5781_c0_g1_i3:70-738(-)
MDSAAGHIVWNVGSKSETTVDKMEVVAAKGRRAMLVGGSYVVFVPEQEFDETVVYEDGFMVMLTTASWDLLRRGLSRGTNAMIQSDTPKGLNIDVLFRGDKEAVPTESGPTTKVVILTPPEKVAEYTNPDLLKSWYTKLVHLIPPVIKENVTLLSKVNTIVVQVIINPERTLVLQIATKPALAVPAPLKKAIEDISKTLPVLKVKGGVQFQLYFEGYSQLQV